MTAAHRRLAALLLGASLLSTACGLKPEVTDSLAATGGRGMAGTGLSSAAGGEGLALESGDPLATGVDPVTGEPLAEGVDPVTGEPIAAGGDPAAAGAEGAAPAGGEAAPGQAPTGQAPAPVTKGTTIGISNDKILIGIHAPLSGASPLPQGSFDRGAKNFWNGKKVHGRSVEVRTLDDKYTPSGAVRACEQLSRETFMVLGAAGTDQIQACGRNRTMASTNTPYISSGVTENGLAGIPTYFASSLTYKQQSPLVIQNAKTQGFAGAGKWALVLSETPNFEDAKVSMEAELKKAGIPYEYIPVPKAGTDSDAAALASKLRSGRYPVVYFLGQPFFFAKTVQQAQGPDYTPMWTGPGPSMAVNSVLSLTCGSNPFNASYLSPYHGFDKAPAGKYADDIEMITAGSMQGVEFMLNQLTPETLNRESLINKLKGGMKIPAGIFPAVDYTRGQFGGTAVYSLKADCGKKMWVTAAGPIGG